VRVEHDDWQRTFDARDVDSPGQRLQGLVERAAGNRHRLAISVKGVVQRGLDRGPAQHVVELVEQDRLPGAGQRGRRICLAGNRGRQSRELFGLQQQLLGAPILGLDARMGRVATAGVVLELVVDGRQRQVDGLFEELRGGAENDVEVMVFAGGLANGVDVGPGRTATVVADTVKAHAGAERLGQAGGAALDVTANVAARGAVLVGQAVGQNLRAVVGLPAEEGAWQPFLVR
jgi:hypothetical protein